MLFLFSLLLSTLSLLSAHVTISPSQFPSGATSIITFNLAHGCNSTSLTNRVEISFPSNLSISMKPIDKVGWKVSRYATEMPYETSPGSGIKANSFRFVWEADTAVYQGLPDWAFDTVQVRITMPAAAQVAIGSKWYVPVLQYCTGGLLDAWNATTTSTDSHAGDLPAPSFTVISTTDVQPVPSQANVKLVSDSLTNLTLSVQALMNGNITPIPSNSTSNATTAPTTAPGTIVYPAAVIVNNYSSLSSASRDRSDALAIISIILSCIAAVAVAYIIAKMQQLKTQTRIINTNTYAQKDTDTQSQDARVLDLSNATSASASAAIPLTAVVGNQAPSQAQAQAQGGYQTMPTPSHTHTRTPSSSAEGQAKGINTAQQLAPHTEDEHTDADADDHAAMGNVRFHI